MNMDVFYLIGVKQIIEHYSGDTIPNGGRIAYLCKGDIPGGDKIFQVLGISVRTCVGSKLSMVL